MRSLLITFVIFGGLVFSQTQTFTYTYGGLPIPIYPDDWDVVGIANISVPRGISITKVTATVQVQFSGVGDLNVYLFSPAGTRTRLLERNCGGLLNIDTTFDDAAPGTFTEFCPTEAGRGPFRGNEPLANFNTQNALGGWRLAVENNGSSRTGTLTGFSLTITGTVLGPPAISANSIVSTSTFEAGTVAPGDFIGIFGFNLGPVGGMRADASQTLPTSLGGTSVPFDGQATPVGFVSDRFVAVQAPFSLAPGFTTQVQLTSSSGTSASIPLKIVATRPGVLTYVSAGNGQAKAINQDGSKNGDAATTSGATGAPRGSIISVYATGLGAVNPPIAAGARPPNTPLSTTVSPVTATIGGRSATVTFSGAAPGQTGVYQVNIMVPAAAPAGANLLVLSAEGNSSQSDVTIQVR